VNFLNNFRAILVVQCVVVSSALVEAIMLMIDFFKTNGQVVFSSHFYGLVGLGFVAILLAWREWWLVRRYGPPRRQESIINVDQAERRSR
jgi:uncharacterized membrane protein